VEVVIVEFLTGYGVGEVGVEGGGAVLAGSFLDGVGVCSGLDELEQGLVFTHRFLGPAGHEPERG
jgi:hypothetical protein